ncbi:SH3 domain-containing protein [Endozoicomonas sp. 8E]|uniref:SH3 domain-containing protein n=1 Tax=Endozoicomonas sp. 8E TaxID=3035692 RepID=UPI002939470C|nr:SH3 domain-containing protein [Endozoicomonas sp. 8E]WOG25399.1 SH3 domain-containing protein [Endozoicomonas sp. 8E]
MKTVKVIEDYQACYPDPVTFSEGDSLILGKSDDEFPGWIWVTSGSGKEGWAPLPLIRRLSQKEGIALEDYNARELSVNVGEDLRILREINAWGWVENQQKQTGWVPISKFAEYSHESN